jgi:hypothetical protein
VVQMKKSRSSTDETNETLPPVPGGSESLESLGHWIDWALGDEKIRKDAGAALPQEELLQAHDAPRDGDGGSSGSKGDPAPANPPAPVPGGNESITKGDDPQGEKR